MEFSPFNKVVKLCLQGMELEERGKSDEAYNIYKQGFDEAEEDYEKFLASYYLARIQKSVSNKIIWLENCLEFALKVNDNSVNSVFPKLYASMAYCYKELNNEIKSAAYLNKSIAYQFNPSDKGPFYHGTKANLKINDLLIAGGNSNYKPEIKMNHIYFTAFANGAGLAAALANGDGDERVYIVEPTGKFENDPNVTDKKFPGNPTRSYRSEAPLKIIGELKEWLKPHPDDLNRFRSKIKNSSGEIIN